MNDLYLAAEKSIEKAKELILKEIPSSEIQAIYVKGSFVQREMNEKSDVDIVVILATNTFLPRVYELSDKYGETSHPPFQIVSYTLSELRTGEYEPNRPKSITTVSRFVKQLPNFPVIYGNPLQGELFTRTNERDFKAHTAAFTDKFIPNLLSGEFKFRDLLKQVIWLTEAELRVKGLNPPYSWKIIAELVNDPYHIVHRALELRSKSDVSDTEKAKFIDLLRVHLEKISK